MPDNTLTKTIGGEAGQQGMGQQGDHLRQTAGETGGEPADAGESSAHSYSLRPLRRMHQLAGEIQAAVARGDMDIMSKAAALLAPSLAQWAEARAGVTPDDPTMLRLWRETQQALADCEQAVSLAMQPIQARSSEIRQHQSRVRQMRVLRQAQTKNLRPSRLLDARR